MTGVALLDRLRSAGHRLAFPVGGLVGATLTGTDVPSNMRDAGTKFRSTVAFVEAFGPDVVFYMGDVAVEAEALGARVDYLDGAMPSVVEPLLVGRDDLAAVRAPDLSDSRTGVNIECVRMLTGRFPELTVLAQVVGPLTLASALLGYEEAMRLVYKDPDFVHEVLERAVTDVLVPYATSQVEAGGSLLWIGEPTGVLLSPPLFERFCLPYLRHLIDAVSVPALVHMCGDSTPHLGLLMQTGALGLSLDHLVDLPRAAQRAPEGVLLIGNIDPVVVMLNGTHEDVRRACDDLLDAMQPYPNFILSTGCSTPFATPPQNVRTLMEAAHKWAV